jgi:hypothetical protein
MRVPECGRYSIQGGWNVKRYFSLPSFTSQEARFAVDLASVSTFARKHVELLWTFCRFAFAALFAGTPRRTFSPCAPGSASLRITRLARSALSADSAFLEAKPDALSVGQIAILTGG